MKIKKAQEIRDRLGSLATTDPERYHGLMDESIYELAQEYAPNEIFNLIKEAQQPRWWACA